MEATTKSAGLKKVIQNDFVPDVKFLMHLKKQILKTHGKWLEEHQLQTQTQSFGLNP